MNGKRKFKQKMRKLFMYIIEGDEYIKGGGMFFFIYKKSSY